MAMEANRCPKCASTCSAKEMRLIGGIAWTRCPRCLEMFESGARNELTEADSTLPVTVLGKGATDVTIVLGPGELAASAPTVPPPAVRGDAPTLPRKGPPPLPAAARRGAYPRIATPPPAAVPPPLPAKKPEILKFERLSSGQPLRSSSKVRNAATLKTSISDAKATKPTLLREVKASFKQRWRIGLLSFVWTIVFGCGIITSALVTAQTARAAASRLRSVAKVSPVGTTARTTNGCAGAPSSAR